MVEVRWKRYPRLAAIGSAHTWLQIRANLGLARNTIEAYGRALEDYLAFTCLSDADVITAGREQVSAYVRDLSLRRNPKRCKVVVIDSGTGLANATLQQRLTAIRLFYDYLIEEGLRTTNPVGRGHYTRGKGFGGIRERGLIPRYSKLPWIPNDTQWCAVLEATRFESLRNRLMLALSYDSALRREELAVCTPVILTRHIPRSRFALRTPSRGKSELCPTREQQRSCWPPTCRDVAN